MLRVQQLNHFLLGFALAQRLDQHLACDEGKVICKVELLGVLRGVRVEQLAEHGQTASATRRPPICGEYFTEKIPHHVKEPNAGDDMLQPVFGCSLSLPELLRSPDPHEGQTITKHTVEKKKRKEFHEQFVFTVKKKVPCWYVDACDINHVGKDGDHLAVIL